MPYFPPAVVGGVSSVFTRAGDVVATTGDYTVAQVTNAASTSYVDNAIAGVNPAVAVTAASAAKLPNSPTYANGASGVGAFITTVTTNTALVVDGVTPTIGQRILVKNEADSGGLGASRNGVYTLSTVAALGVAWILTRATDFNSPSDMNSTGAIPVINGTANGTTQWVISSQVNTVGTDAVTFAQFSVNPALYVNWTQGA